MSVSVHGCLSRVALWWTGDLSRVYPAVISPNRLKSPHDPTDGLSGYRKWMDGWISYSIDQYVIKHSVNLEGSLYPGCTPLKSHISLQRKSLGCYCIHKSKLKLHHAYNRNIRRRSRNTTVFSDSDHRRTIWFVKMLEWFLLVLLRLFDFCYDELRTEELFTNGGNWLCFLNAN